MVNVPAAVGKLPFADVPDALFLQHGIDLAPASACRARSRSTACCPPSTRPPNNLRAIADAAGFSCARWTATCKSSSSTCVRGCWTANRAPADLGRRMILGIRDRGSEEKIGRRMGTGGRRPKVENNNFSWFTFRPPEHGPGFGDRAPPRSVALRRRRLLHLRHGCRGFLDLLAGQMTPGPPSRRCKR